jgi:hypothetical protein
VVFDHVLDLWKAGEKKRKKERKKEEKNRGIVLLIPHLGMRWK